MGYQLQAVELLVGRGMLAQEDALVVELDGTGMLHAAELIARQHHEAEFLEGIGYAGIVFQPPQRQGHLVEDGLQLCHLLRVGLTVEGFHLAAVACGGRALEASGGEREQIGGQQVGLLELYRRASVGSHLAQLGPVADGPPSVGNIQGELEGGFQVGLVEAGEHTAGMVGHKERVEIVVVAVERLVAAPEVEVHRVAHTHVQELFLYDDVLVGEGGKRRYLLLFLFVGVLLGEDGAAPVELVALTLEVEHHIALAVPPEADGGMPPHQAAPVGRNGELQVVFYSAQLGGALLGQFERHPFSEYIGMCHAC